MARLQAGERPLQVLQNLQISDGDKNGSMTLLRDQIVVQVRDTHTTFHFDGLT